MGGRLSRQWSGSCFHHVSGIRVSSGTSWLHFPGAQLAAAVRRESGAWELPENLPQGGLGDARKRCRAARGLSAKHQAGGTGHGVNLVKELH